MTRSLYQFVLWMHPPAFRRRFRDEMMCIFDEGGARHSRLALLLDGFTSLLRQWLLRTSCWKILIAMSGAYIQVWGFGLPTKGHQVWARNPQLLTPYLEQLMLLALGFICSLFVMIMSLTLWVMRFQRLRREGHRMHLAGAIVRRR